MTVKIEANIEKIKTWDKQDLNKLFALGVAVGTTGAVYRHLTQPVRTLERDLKLRKRMIEKALDDAKRKAQEAYESRPRGPL